MPQDALPILKTMRSCGGVLGWTAWFSPNPGERKVLSGNTACLVAENEITGVMAVIEDVTEVRKARDVQQQSKEELEELMASRTRELSEANARLLQLDEMKCNFLSIVSHDLRTPLTSILGFAKVISKVFSKYFAPLASTDSRLKQISAWIDDNLNIMENEGKRLARLINDLLDISRIESGRYSWKEKSLDLTVLTRNTSSTGSTRWRATPVKNRLGQGRGLPYANRSWSTMEATFSWSRNLEKTAPSPLCFRIKGRGVQERPYRSLCVEHIRHYGLLPEQTAQCA